MNPVRKSLIAAGLTAAALLALAAPAAAHHPEISAKSACLPQPSLVITATSWQTENPAHRVNYNVSVAVDGSTVGVGTFTAPTFSFSLTVPATVGQHTVRATAVAGFGPAGEYGNAGSYREVTVDVTGGCILPCYNNAQIRVPGCDYGTTTTVPPTTTSTMVAPLPPLHPATPICGYNAMLDWNDPKCVPPVEIDDPAGQTAVVLDAEPVELAFTGPRDVAVLGLSAGAFLAIGAALIAVSKKNRS